MEMMRIQSTEERTENRSQEKGCYTVEELMDILCVGGKGMLYRRRTHGHSLCWS